MRLRDDCNKQMADLVKFAGEYKANPNSVGVLISFMGDGMPAFMTALSKELEPLGPEYQPIILPIAHGKSYGEDQIMGPVSLEAGSAERHWQVCGRCLA